VEKTGAVRPRSWDRCRRPSVARGEVVRRRHPSHVVKTGVAAVRPPVMAAPRSLLLEFTFRI
jgi:hypothetical protein